MRRSAGATTIVLSNMTPSDHQEEPPCQDPPDALSGLNTLLELLPDTLPKIITLRETREDEVTGGDRSALIPWLLFYG